MSTASSSAAVLHGPKDMRMEQRPLFAPRQGECQVRVISTGLCGSDLHYYTHGRNGDFALQAPLVLGHEASGVITAVGPGVRDRHVGQRVAIEAGVMCNNCSYCSSGRYNLCKQLRFCSSAKTFPHLDGTLQTTLNHPSHVLHPMPDTCSFDQAALAEPLSVLLHASKRASLSAGQSVLVFGVGAIGLLAGAVAKATGARRVCAIDINADRLAFAKNEGFADETFCLPPAPRPANHEEALARAKTNAAAALKTFGEEDGFDVIFECTGAEPCIQLSIHTAITGGKVMLVGMGSRDVMLPLSAAALREVDIQGSFRYANTYPRAIELLGQGKLANIDKLVTHRFPLERSADAFALLAKGRDEEGRMVLKVMVDGPQ